MNKPTSIEIVTSEQLREIVREVIVEEVPKLIPQKSTEGKVLHQERSRQTSTHHHANTG
jgi:hypothetical protein